MSTTRGPLLGARQRMLAIERRVIVVRLVVHDFSVAQCNVQRRRSMRDGCIGTAARRSRVPTGHGEDVPWGRCSPRDHCAESSGSGAAFSAYPRRSRSMSSTAAPSSLAASSSPGRLINRTSPATLTNALRHHETLLRPSRSSSNDGESPAPTMGSPSTARDWCSTLLRATPTRLNCARHGITEETDPWQRRGRFHSLPRRTRRWSLLGAMRRRRSRIRSHCQ